MAGGFWSILKYDNIKTMNDEETKNKNIRVGDEIKKSSEINQNDSIKPEDDSEVVEFEFNDDGEEDLKKTLKKYLKIQRVLKQTFLFFE